MYYWSYFQTGQSECVSRSRRNVFFLLLKHCYWKIAYSRPMAIWWHKGILTTERWEGRRSVNQLWSIWDQQKDIRHPCSHHQIVYMLNCILVVLWVKGLLTDGSI